jgi:hypothetical protein
MYGWYGSDLQVHTNAITGTISTGLSVLTQLEYVQGSLALLCVLLSLHFQVKPTHSHTVFIQQQTSYRAYNRGMHALCLASWEEAATM